MILYDRSLPEFDYTRYSNDDCEFYRSVYSALSPKSKSVLAQIRYDKDNSIWEITYVEDTALDLLRSGLLTTYGVPTQFCIDLLDFQVWDRERYEHEKKVERMKRHGYRLNKAHERRRGGKIKKSVLDEMYKEQKGKCAYCGCNLHGEYHLEHINPISRGGTSNRVNLCLACPTCNLRKNARKPDEWRWKLAKS